MNKKNKTPVEGKQNRSTMSSIERHISEEIAKHDWSIQLKIALACRKLASEEHAQTLAGHVTVQDYVILAGMVAVHQFCNIGRHAFIAGGSLVRKDIPPFVKAAREPLSYVGINSVGLRRRGFDSKTIKDIQNIYRILFQKKYNNSQAINIIEAEVEATKDRDEILMFIKNSQRGIMKGYIQN